jgi:hypothetical protein
MMVETLFSKTFSPFSFLHIVMGHVHVAPSAGMSFSTDFFQTAYKTLLAAYLVLQTLKLFAATTQPTVVTQYSKFSLIQRQPIASWLL